MNSCCGPDPLKKYGCEEAEVVAEIEDCLGDDCGGALLPSPPPPPAEDPSEPDPWDPIIPDGGSYSPLRNARSG